MSCSEIRVEIVGDVADFRVYVQQAQAAQQAAEAAATAADTSESAAAQSAQQSVTHATQAQQSATAAEQSSTAASQAVAAATQIKTDVQAEVANAAQSAAQAAVSAGQADGSATQADSSATRAEAAAVRAESAPVRLKVSEGGTLLNETASEFNFTGAGVTVKQPTADPSIFTIEIPGQQPVAVTDVTGLITALAGKEPALGNPTSDYMVLASKADGSRYWIAQSASGGSGLRAGKVGSTQYPVTDIQLGDGLGFSYNVGTVTILAEVTQAELDTLTAKVAAIHAHTPEQWQAAFDAAIAQYVTRLTAAEATVTHNTAEINALQSDVTTLHAEVQQLRGDKIDKVESKVSPASKTITLTFKAGQTVVDTDLIDISAMFATNPPATLHELWFGFTTAKPPTETGIKAGTSEQDAVIIGHDVTLTRATGTPAYMYVWIPDALGSITGFSFAHAFVDVWQDYPVTVNGVDGKVYVSDNKTAATSVSFEVQ